MNKGRLERFDEKREVGNKILFLGLGLISLYFLTFIFKSLFTNHFLLFLAISGASVTMLGVTILVFNVFEDYIKYERNKNVN